VILDTSAIVAILLNEDDAGDLLEKLAADTRPAVSSATLTEAGIVLSARLRKDARGLLSRFLQEAGVAIIPFGEAHFSAAVDAWLRYGKGHHPAALNFGDCIAFATADLAGEPLLCVGNDFPRTDLPLA
jgi:ribonuclease VapC